MSEEQGTQASKGASSGLGCGVIALIGLFVIVAGTVLAMVVGGGGDDRGDTPQARRVAAENACEGWVRDQLKAPSTAKFPDTTTTGDGPWTVTGVVDAENSFGAALRSTWTCEVRLDGDTFRGRAVVDGG